MQYRELGRTRWKVSEISFGAWAIGGGWGSVDDSESMTALRRAIQLGVNFIDTADVTKFIEHSLQNLSVDSLDVEERIVQGRRGPPAS